MANGVNNTDERVTVSFNLPKDTYDQLCARLKGYGERTMFFRILVDRFLANELKITVPQREL